MPQEEAPVPNRIKSDLGPYCPVCTPAGYRCVCNTVESDWDDTVTTYQPVPQVQIKPSWFQAQMMPQTLAKMTPQGESAPNSPRSESTQTASEQMDPDDFIAPTSKPSDLRKVIWERTQIRPHGELLHRPDSLYADPIDRCLYDEPDEEEEKKTIREGMDKFYEPVEDKKTIV